MQNGDGRMKILILSCNTGEGHNSAGWAVKEYLELQGHQVVMEDMMLLKERGHRKLWAEPMWES